VSDPSILIIEADLVSETLLSSDGVRHSRVACSNWRPAVHMRPETTCNRARKIRSICYWLPQARLLYLLQMIFKIVIFISSKFIKLLTLKCIVKWKFSRENCVKHKALKENI
jgi:hypothetical protein